jgi:chromatin structure-remodeling complex subunit SFH1
MDRPRRSARASNAPQLGYPAPAFTSQPLPTARLSTSTSSSRPIPSTSGGGSSSSSINYGPGSYGNSNGGYNGMVPGGSSFSYGTPPLGHSMGIASTPPMGGKSTLASFPISKTSAPVPPHVRIGPGQARHSTFASRARQGISTLMQPLPSGPDLHDPLKSTISGLGMDYGTTERTRGGGTRRRAAAGMTYYGEDGSDFEEEDDADASGVGTPSKGDTPLLLEEEEEKAGALLGMPPPGNKVISKRAHRTHPLYASEADLLDQADTSDFLIPIKIELETETHRIKDVFSWNMREHIIKPKDFARVFVRDLDLPPDPYTSLVEQAIIDQVRLAEQSGIDLVDIGPAQGGPFASRKNEKKRRDARSWNWGIKRRREDCKEEDATEQGVQKWDTEGKLGEFEDDIRVIIDYDVQIYKHHLRDRLEWDLCSPLTPDAFAIQISKDMCLSGEALPIISNAIREQLLNHHRSAIELDLIGKGTEYGRWQQEIEDAEREEAENARRKWRGLPLLPLKPLQMMQEEQEEESEVLGPRRRRLIGGTDDVVPSQEESRVATPTPKTNVILRTPAQRKGIAEYFQHQLTEKGPRR